MTDKERFMRRAQDRLYANAACLGKPPILFDQTEFDSLYTELALQICAKCPVQEDCLLIVNPWDTYFDGIAGGIVFKNGVVMDKSTLPKPPKLRKSRK